MLVILTPKTRFTKHLICETLLIHKHHQTNLPVFLPPLNLLGKTATLLTSVKRVAVFPSKFKVSEKLVSVV